MTFAHLTHIDGEIADVDYETIIESRDGFQLTYSWLRETYEGDNVAELRDGCWYVAGDPRPFSDVTFSETRPALLAVTVP